MLEFSSLKGGCGGIRSASHFIHGKVELHILHILHYILYLTVALIRNK
jgi:hypothetical protein